MFNCAPKTPLLPVKKKKANYLTWFYIISYNFLNYPVFIDIKQTLHYKFSNRVTIIRKTFIFMDCCLIFVSYFFCWAKFCSGCLKQGFFLFGRQKKWSLVALKGHLKYSNDYMGVCLDGISIGHLRRVVILQSRSFEQVWL